MEVRMPDGKIYKARITTDNMPDRVWEIRVFNDDGTIAVSARSREEIVAAGIQIVKNNWSEDDALGRAGFRPPYDNG